MVCGGTGDACAEEFLRGFNVGAFAAALNDYALILRNKGRVQDAEPLLREGLEFSAQVPLKYRSLVSTMRTNISIATRRSI
jgi:hypothetical protein